MTANVLYPGYYPGDRPFNPNMGRGRPTKPAPPQDWSGLDYFFSDLEKDLDIPQKIKGLIADEFTKSWQVGIEGNGISVTDVLNLGDEAQEEYPQAAYINPSGQSYFGFSLNYLDLIKDPGKTLGDVGRQMFESAADWEDIRGSVLKKLIADMYMDPRNGDRHVLARDPANPYAIYDKGFTLRMRAHAMRAFADQGLNNLIKTNNANLNPFSLEGATAPTINEAVMINGKKFISSSNPYDDARNKAVEFSMLSRVPNKREGAFDEVLSKAYKATLTDLEQTIEASVTVPDGTSMEDKVRVFLTNKGLAPAQVNEGVELFTQFTIQNNLASSANKLHSYLTGRTGLVKNLDLAVSHRGAFGLDPRVAKLNPTASAAVTKSLGEYSDKLTAARASIAEAAAGIRSFTPDKRKKYEGILKKYERDLTSLEKLQGSVDKFIAKPNVVTALNIRNNITSITSAGIRSGGIGGGSTLVHGIQRSILRDMQKDFKGKFGTMFMQFTSRATGPGGALSPITRGQTILGTMNWFTREYNYALATEILDNYEGGRLFKVYVWPVLKAKASVFIPSYWVSNALQKAHQFGLVIKDDYLEGSVFEILLDWEDSTNPIKQAVRSIFVNKVKFSFDTTDASILVRRTVRMFGGKHLKFGLSLKGLVGGGKSGVFTKGAMAELSNKLIEIEGIAGIDWLNLTDTMKKQISDSLLDAGFLTNLQAANNGVFVFKKADEATEFVENYINFRAWLAKNPARAGVDSISDIYSNEESVGSFLVGLLNYVKDNNNLNVGRQLVGLAEKVASALNKTQALILNKLAPILKPFIYYEQVLIRGGTNLVMGLLSKLGGVLVSALSKLGIAVGSIGGPIGQVIGFIVSLFVRKLVKTGEDFLKAVFKGDIDAFFKGLGKAADTAIKTSLYACLPFVGCGALIGGIFVVILGAIPSSNEAVGGGYYGFGGGPVQALEPCPDDVVLDTSNTCFFQEGNFIATNSYNNADEYYNDEHDFGGGDGHGSNAYYLAVTGDEEENGLCHFILPSVIAGTGGPHAPTVTFGPNNVCFNKGKTPQSDLYGRAIDVAPSNDSCYSIFLPNINGEVESWSVGTAYDYGTGNATVATGMVGGVPKYKLLMGHISSSYSGDGKSPGERAAEIYDWGNNTHVHAELAISNGVGGYNIVKPEDYVCN